MQQGRVQLDADWNEQTDIGIHRAQTTTRDLVGACGGPLKNAAFKVTPVLPRVAGADDFTLGAGRYYVNGILCENEQDVRYSAQPDFPGAMMLGNVPLNTDGHYLLYLDVWQRHLTVLDDPHIRETALGGPDTATRTKTVWQAKLWKVVGAPSFSCPEVFSTFKVAVGDRNKGLLNASSAPEDPGSNPCIVPPSAGFRGLENLLYRVEVHAGGAALDVSTNTGSVISSFNTTVHNQLTMSAGPAPGVGAAVELFSARAGSDLMAGRLYFVTNVSGLTLTLNRDIEGLEISQAPRLRVAGATFKWSRQNGSVVTKVERISTEDNKQITVQSLGPDDDLGFSDGDWVELTDDLTELRGQPGQLTQIVTADNAARIVVLKDVPTVVTSRNAKLRRWDGIAAVRTNPADANRNWIALENGLRIQFLKNGADASQSGVYATGDYWLIPTRTATADRESGQIEWPLNPTSGRPEPQPPEGIEHYYCPLAVLDWSPGLGIYHVSDCRRLFPPVTELTTLQYVSGTGQKFIPTLIPAEQKLVELLHPLVVGVSNGTEPVEGAHVVFEIMEGDDQTAVPTLAGPAAPAPNGRLSAVPGDPAIGGPDTRLEVVTDSHGRARCKWEVSTSAYLQQVRATLLGQDGKVIHLPVYFGAHKSVADEVAYKPGCPKLDGIQTVQAALDELCKLLGHLDESGIHVTDISFGALALRELERMRRDAPSRATLPAGTEVRREALLPESKSIPNDFDLACDALAQGLMITCDGEVFRNSVRGKPTCFITLELPFPSGPSDKEAWGLTDNDTGFFGYQPVVLAGEPDVQGQFISWNPSQFAGRWLREILPTLFDKFDTRIAGTQHPGRLLARLTLKGNYIWSLRDPKLYLDGELFGITDEDGVVMAAQVPSGDGKRGGDLEMWFWLVEFKVGVERPDLNAGESTRGIVELSGPAPPQGATVKLSISDPAVATLTRNSVTFKEGDTQSAFEVKGSKQGQVVITASYAGGERHVTVRVSDAKSPRVEGVRVFRWQVTPGTQVLKEMNPSTGFPGGRVLVVQQTQTPNAIEVKFTDDVPVNFSTVTPNTFLVEAVAGHRTVLGSFTQVLNTNAVLWKADQLLQPDDYQVVLRGADITSDKGKRLDGEPRQLPSGDGQEGGNFTFTVRVEKAPTPQVTLLKVRRVSLINNLTFIPEATIFERREGGFTIDNDLGLDQKLNVVEVEFTGGPVNRESVRKDVNFCLWRMFANSVVQLQSGTLEWRSDSVVRWTAPQVLAPSVYTFALLAGESPVVNVVPATPITATDGRQLDGEPTQLPSGNNQEGGTFFFRFTVTANPTRGPGGRVVQ